MYKSMEQSQKNASYPNSPDLSEESIKRQCRNDTLGYDPTGVSEQTKIYNVSICVVIRNEAQFLLEWIAYHITIGIDHFFVYDDNSTDEFEKLLQPIIDQNLITLHKRSYNSISILDTKRLAQPRFLRHCGYTHAYKSKWLISIDIDEFVVIKNTKYNNNIQNWINWHENLKQTGVVLIPRETLAGHYEPITQKQLVTTEVVYKTAPEFTQDIKPFVNTNGLDLFWVHFAFTFLPIKNTLLDYNITINNNTLITGFENDPGILNCTKIQDISIFHYKVRSYEECILKTNLHLFYSTYRNKRGNTLCKQYVWGVNIYPQLWSKDEYLANQSTIICAKMRELNKDWFHAHSMCAHYQI
eukprot:TRINITY_DN14852_c0_g1_i1.p1 TRINITY_DN14852_c0_g1~~TRINITY_DN14852_c0_g1_i1.p1  ORF type:complete len:356 (-),score=0.70 TRINITY_DN14852_c0_g1_i1:782-1849(-)